MPARPITNAEMWDALLGWCPSHVPDRTKRATVDEVGHCPYEPGLVLGTKNGSFTAQCDEHDTLGPVIVWWSYSTVIAKYAVAYNAAIESTMHYSNTTSRHVRNIAGMWSALRFNGDIADSWNKLTRQAVVDQERAATIEQVKKWTRARDHGMWGVLTAYRLSQLAYAADQLDVPVVLPDHTTLMSKRGLAKLTGTMLQGDQRVIEVVQKYNQLTEGN